VPLIRNGRVGTIHAGARELTRLSVDIAAVTLVWLGAVLPDPPLIFASILLASGGIPSQCGSGRRNAAAAGPADALSSTALPPHTAPPRRGARANPSPLCPVS